MTNQKETPRSDNHKDQIVLLGEDSVDNYLAELSQAITNISRPEIWAVVDVLFSAWRKNRRIFICGNGGSAATASHMANDLNKQCTIEGKRRMRAIALTDNVPLMTAFGNDKDFADIFVEQLLNHIEAQDVVIGISTSGNSENVLRAMRCAKEYGALSIGFTGDRGGQLDALVDYSVHIPDPDIGRQEDGHLILNHVIASTLKRLIQLEKDQEIVVKHAEEQSS